MSGRLTLWRRSVLSFPRPRRLGVLGGLLILAALTAAPPPALAAGTSSVGVLGLSGSRVVSEVTVPFTSRGTLTVAYHGDPAAGCATVGVCAYRGTIVAPAPGAGRFVVVTLRNRGRIEHQALGIDSGGFGNGPQTISVVDRSLGGGAAARCSDTVGEPGIFDSAAARGHTFSFRLFDAYSGLLATRCAGPTDAALASLAPRISLPLAAVRRGHRTLNLARTVAFAADGYAGTLTSTVILRLGAARRVNDHQSFPPNVSLVRERNLQARLGIARLSGRLTAHIIGAAAGVCELLDSCGLSETLVWTPAAADVQGAIAASASVTVARRRLLAGLGEGHARRPILAFGGVAFTDPVPASVVSDQAGLVCRDRTGPDQDQLLLATTNRRLNVSLTTTSPLHSGCPGPLLGSSNSTLTLASGSVRLGALAGRLVTVTLRAAPGTLADDGYRIGLAGQITLVLRRGRLRESFFRVPFFGASTVTG